MAISFFALCVLSMIVGQTKGNFYGSHSASDHAISALVESTTLLKREKRQSDSYCVTVCAFDMLLNTDRHMPELSSKLGEREEEGPSYTNIFTEYQFKTFCKSIFKPFDQCLDRCQMSQSLAIWKARVSPLKYMCVDYYSEFYNSLPCRNSVRNETVTKCIDGVCQQRKNAPIHLLNALKNFKATEDIEGLKYYLAENCKLISCVARCQDQILEDKCGLDVMTLIRNYLKVYSSNIRKVYQLRGISWIYPTECTNMAEYHITQTMRPKAEFGNVVTTQKWYDLDDYVDTNTVMPNVYDEATYKSSKPGGWWEYLNSTASNRYLNTLLILLLQVFCFAAFHFGLY